METMMLILQIIVLLGAIFVGIRLGGIGIGYAGGIGVIILGLGLGMTPGAIPWDVILIIMSVIAAISAMQLAGGLDYLVQIAERILRSNPKYINYLAPTVTYFLTILAGTGHTAFSMIPVIVEVAKEQNIKPSAPLSIAVVSSQIAITASPVSAAVVYMTGVLEPLGWSYPLLLGIWIPTTFVGCMITAFIMTMFYDLDLSKDPVYQERLAQGLVKAPVGAQNMELKEGAKLSVAIFVIGVLCVVLYATAISKIGGKPVLIENVIVGRDAAIMSFMLGIATLIVMLCKIKPDKIADTSVFKSGMVACVCIGCSLAWKYFCRWLYKRNWRFICRVSFKNPSTFGSCLFLCKYAFVFSSSNSKSNYSSSCSSTWNHCGKSGRFLYACCFICGGFCTFRASNLSNTSRCCANGRYRFYKNWKIYFQSRFLGSGNLGYCI